MSDAFREASDAELVERVLSGDQDAFEKLFRRHSRSVFAIARRILPPWCAIDAADLVQEIFAKMYRSLDAYDSTRPFQAWFHAIAKHAAIDRLRQCHRQLRGPMMAVPHADPLRLPDDAARVEYSEVIRRSHEWVNRNIDASQGEVRRGAHLRIDRVGYVLIARECGYASGECARVMIRTVAVAALFRDGACQEAREIQTAVNEVFARSRLPSERHRKVLFLNVMDVEKFRHNIGDAHG